MEVAYRKGVRGRSSKESGHSTRPAQQLAVQVSSQLQIEDRHPIDGKSGEKKRPPPRRARRASSRAPPDEIAIARPCESVERVPSRWSRTRGAWAYRRLSEGHRDEQLAAVIEPGVIVCTACLSASGMTQSPDRLSRSARPPTRARSSVFHVRRPAEQVRLMEPEILDG